MKKIISLFFIVFAGVLFAQSKEELTKAILSNNQEEILDFIQKYPNNPNNPLLKKRMEMVKGNVSAVVKAPLEPISKDKLEKQLDKIKDKNELAVKTQNSESLINHLFSNDPNKKEAYVLIKNNSDCNVVVKIESNKNYYSLDIPKQSENYVLVAKGNYSISTMICTAKYSSIKNISEDMQINLSAKKVRK